MCILIFESFENTFGSTVYSQFDHCYLAETHTVSDCTQNAVCARSLNLFSCPQEHRVQIDFLCLNTSVDNDLP